MTGFSQSLSGERKGGRNTGLRHLPASSETVSSCCKVGCWSSEMNPTDVLKQIGLVGVASERNNLLDPPRKEKERAASYMSPLPLQEPSPVWRMDCLHVGCLTEATSCLVSTVHSHEDLHQITWLQPRYVNSHAFLKQTDTLLNSPTLKIFVQVNSWIPADTIREGRNHIPFPTQHIVPHEGARKKGSVISIINILHSGGLWKPQDRNSVPTPLRH